MRRAAVARARLWIGAVACAGVVVSHGIAYRLVAPDAPQRTELMGATGHRFFPLVVAAALVALVIGLGDFVTESIAVRRRVLAPGNLFSFAGVRLAALQATGFIGLEALERLSGGEHHFATALLTEPATLFGLALQLLSALTAALILVALRRFIIQIRSPRRRTAHSSAPAGSTRVSRPCLTLVAGDAAPRAPPATV
ncbi:MAG: hypothetical protein M3Q18_05030 [Actinomycetota bacterium]|nr:hypothetical protein [Actinomycetota bacterium]